MGKVTYSSKWGRTKTQAKTGAAPKDPQSAQDAVRAIKQSAKRACSEDYREKSLALHGLICARCGREFDHTQRHLLTVHHKDGNHHYNPPDGSNWENLCVYCHEDVHSRAITADYLGDHASTKETALVYQDQAQGETLGLMAEKLKKALQDSRKK